MILDRLRSAPKQREYAKFSLLREASGALGDLGVLLPYALGVITSGILVPMAVFGGFGIAYIVTGIIYRMPVAVQPMKAIGALALAGELDAVQIAVTGVVIGFVLLALSLSGAIHRFARAIPQTVSVGLQLGLGLMLGWFALSLMAPSPLIAAAGLGALLILSRSATVPAALIVILGAAALNLAFGETTAPVTVVVPSATGGDLMAMSVAVLAAVLPQLPLTLANAIFVTAALARDLAPARSAGVTGSRLALTTGVFNIVLPPLGAMPMCHGAGGLAAHHRFGARTGLAPIMIGAVLLAIAAIPTETGMHLLSAIPVPVLGALLLFSAKDLAFSPRLFDAVPSCRCVIAITGIVTVISNPAIGFCIGLGSEMVRKRLVRFIFSRSGNRQSG